MIVEILEHFLLIVISLKRNLTMHWVGDLTIVIDEVLRILATLYKFFNNLVLG